MPPLGSSGVHRRRPATSWLSPRSIRRALCRELQSDESPCVPSDILHSLHYAKEIICTFHADKLCHCFAAHEQLRRISREGHQQALVVRQDSTAVKASFD